MNRFLKLSGEEKREVFQAVSLSMGLRSDIVEKDFWVCFMLKSLLYRHVIDIHPSGVCGISDMPVCTHGFDISKNIP